MDLEEWELLPEEGFLEIHDDGGKKIYSRSVLQANYFVCPPTNQRQFLHLPFDLNSQPNSSSSIPVLEFNITAPQDSETIDQDSVSQVFFKKMMNEADHQFADMKLESPRIVPQIEGSYDGPFHFEEKIVDLRKEDEDDDDDDDEGGLLNLWKRSFFTGIGAICSFGFAAATLCIIVFSSGHGRSKHLQNHKLTFQIYTSDKVKEAMAGISGIPVTRAHITVGGYYDGAL